MATDSKLQKHLHSNTPSPQKLVSRSGFYCVCWWLLSFYVFCSIASLLSHFGGKKEQRDVEKKKKTFHLLIRWSHQQSIEMRLSLLRHIEWPTKEHRGSKSKESLIWSCEWQYWFAFAFLTGWNSESEPKVMETITVTTCCLSCLPSVLHSALRLYRYQVLLFFSFFLAQSFFEA